MNLFQWTTSGRSFLISLRSDLYLNLWIYGQNSTDSWRTTHYDDRKSQRNKASKMQKLAFQCFLLTSAKAKKFQDGNWSIRVYTTISLQLSLFFKNHHNCLSERLAFYPAMCSTRSETKHSPRLRGNTQTHTHKPIAITLRLCSG